MSDRKREPTDADGPLFREAYRRAGEVDEAQGTPGRRRAWVGFLGAGLAALAEGLLREAAIWGGVLFSILAGVFGATSGDPIWAVPMVVCGVIGIVLVFLAAARKWSFGKQWATLLSVILVQAVLIVGLWVTH